MPYHHAPSYPAYEIEWPREDLWTREILCDRKTNEGRRVMPLSKKKPTARQPTPQEQTNEILQDMRITLDEILELLKSELEAEEDEPETEQPQPPKPSTVGGPP